MSWIRSSVGISINANDGHGGLASTLSQGSIVERCFVWVDTPAGASRGGMIYRCANSTIRYCALGKTANENSSSLGRIAQNIDGTCALQHNISLDSIAINGASDAQGKDGKSVSAALFNQHYFEHTLGWDFNKVWQWNSTLNRPQLQSVGVGAVVDGFKSLSSNSNGITDDLLTQQIRANIWL